MSRRLMASLYAHGLFAWLRWRHRAAIREAKPLAEHLETEVFPERTEDGQGQAVLATPDDGRCLVLRGPGDYGDRDLPGTDHVAAALAALGIAEVRLDTRMERDQVLEALLVTLYAGPMLASAAPGDAAEATWDRRRLASAMVGSAGLHRFCLILRFHRDAGVLAVEYTYCELFYSRVVNSWIDRLSRTRDHRALFAAAPWLGLHVGLLLLLGLALWQIGATVAVVGGVVLAVAVGGTVGLLVYTLGSVQHDREHRDALLREHLRELREMNETLEYRVRVRTYELLLTRDVTIMSLTTLAETRDRETGEHIQRTQLYVKTLAERLRNHPRFRAVLRDDETIDQLYRSAPLHDIGKVGVPDAILLKPGRLTPEEFDRMKQHPVYGGDALRWAESRLGSNSFLQFAREIAYHHHEKWDGSGYPLGLAGDAIPVGARLMALADVYDALISKRYYKEAFPHEQARQILLEGRGRHFDPDVVDAFIATEAEFQRIAREFVDPETPDDDPASEARVVGSSGDPAGDALA